MTKDSSAENVKKFEVNVFSDQVSVSIYEKTWTPRDSFREVIEIHDN